TGCRRQLQLDAHGVDRRSRWGHCDRGSGSHVVAHRAEIERAERRVLCVAERRRGRGALLIRARGRSVSSESQGQYRTTRAGVKSAWAYSRDAKNANESVRSSVWCFTIHPKFPVGLATKSAVSARTAHVTGEPAAANGSTFCEPLACVAKSPPGFDHR